MYVLEEFGVDLGSGCLAKKPQAGRRQAFLFDQSSNSLKRPTQRSFWQATKQQAKRSKELVISLGLGYSSSLVALLLVNVTLSAFK